MPIRFSSNLALIGALWASAAFADPSQVPAVTDAQTETGKAPPLAEPEKRICKSEGVTGTRIPPKKTCKTKAEWELHARDAQEEMRARMRSPRNPGTMIGE